MVGPLKRLSEPLSMARAPSRTLLAQPRRKGKLLPMFLLLSAALAAEISSDTVAAVPDGDVMNLVSGERVQLRGVRAPSSGQDYGIEAREAARAMVSGQEVVLSVRGDPRDEHGRLVASVRSLEGDLALSLVERGYAWIEVVPPDDLDLTMLRSAQRAARAARRGVWATERFAGAFHIVEFIANAEGDDRDNINGELLRIGNISDQDLNLKGYSLRDRNGNMWILPSVVVPVGQTIQIRSGMGSNQINPRQPLVIYLGSDRPIWNNTEDQATLTDRSGRVVDVVKQQR